MSFTPPQSATQSTPPPPQKLTFTIWMILIIASIGFAFDIYELLMLPLVLREAVFQLTGERAGSPTFQHWARLLFFVPAFIGGLVGLLGGYLTDWLGRRRVLTWSILLYASSAFASGFSTNMYMLLVLRTTTFIGVCVEFVAAVAWLAELFPNPQQREKVLGYTQAFSSIGGLLVAVANNAAALMVGRELLPMVALPSWLSFLGDIPVGGPAWRYTLMSGLIPALPLLLIRPFLPESPAWAKKKAEGTLKRPSLFELFAPRYRRTTIVTTLMFACSYGAAYGAIQHLPQIVPGLKDVKADIAKAVEGKSTADATRIRGAKLVKAGSEYVKLQEIGGLLGRFTLAVVALYVLRRRWQIRLFQIPALFVLPLVFWFFLNMENRTFFVLDLEFLLLGRFPVTSLSLLVLLCGFVVVAQFSFWGNYLPLVYPVHLRGTGESVAANIGGRIIGTSFAALTLSLGVDPDPTTAPQTLAHVAAMVGFVVTFAGLVLSFFLPEPKGELD